MDIKWSSGIICRMTLCAYILPLMATVKTKQSFVKCFVRAAYSFSKSGPFQMLWLDMEMYKYLHITQG